VSRLEQLLTESRRAAEARQSQAFDCAAAPFQDRIVIYGSGGLGRRLASGLRANGVEPLAFADRSPAAWERPVAGLTVLSPDDAAARFGADSAFVIAVWHPVPAGGLCTIAADLKGRGCQRVVPFSLLFWKYPRTFLPYYLWDLPGRVLEAAGDVRRAFSLFGEPRSQNEFVRQIEFRLTADFGCLEDPDGGPQYFPRHTFHPRPDECFVDCGAYNGDTLLDFAEWTGGQFRKVIAFEADPENFAALERTVAGDARLRGRVRSVRQAVGLQRSTVRFAASGLASAAISDAGDVEVECASLDESLMDESPTYIKMDIEGAEMEALMGAAAVLRAHRPTLAICAYHTQDHLWRIPLRIRELHPDATLLLRPHCADGFDLVCYALPPDRSER
jgi:FkbM family methyltransferase